MEFLQVTEFARNVFAGKLHLNIFSLVIVRGLRISSCFLVSFVDNGVVMDWGAVSGRISCSIRVLHVVSESFKNTLIFCT